MVRTRTLGIAAFLLLLFLVFVPAPVAAAITYTEDFDNDTTGGLPSESWYTFVPTGNVFVSAQSPTIGTKSLLVGDGSVAEFDAPSSLWNLCSGGVSLSAAFRFNEAPNAVGFSEIIQVRDGAAGTAWSLLIDNTGVFQGRIGATTTNFAGISFAAAQWYNVTFSFTSCSLEKVSIFLSGNSQEGSVSIDAPGATGGLDRFKLLVSGPNFAATANAKFDLVSINNVADPPPVAVGSTATAAVVGLTGFDVDPEGAGLIVRTSSGDTVRSFNPTGTGSLTQRGSDRNTDCDEVGNQVDDMVTSSGVALAMIICDATTKDPTFLSIRSFTLGTFDFPGDCSPDDDCLDDIHLIDDCPGFDDDADLLEIQDLAVIPLDYSYITSNEIFVDDARAVAVAYSTDTGFVGVLQYTTRTGLDACNEERNPFSGSSPEQISVWRPDPDDDKTLIAAVDSGGAAKVYAYVPAIVNQDNLDGTMDAGNPIGGLTGGVAVDCAGTRCLVVTNAANDNVRLVELGNGTSLWRKTAASEVVRGAAYSANGFCSIWVDGSTVNVAYSTNGTVFGSLTIPSGTFKGIRVHESCQRAWIATTTTVAYYDIQTSFPNIIPSECLNPPCIGDPTPTAAPSVFVAPVIPGVSEFGANLLFGVVLTAMTTAGIGFSPEMTRQDIEAGTRKWLMLVGALLGFLIAWAVGYFSTAVVVFLVVAAITFIVVRGAIGRGDD